MKRKLLMVLLAFCLVGVCASTGSADENPIDLRQSSHAWVAWTEVSGAQPIIFAAQWDQNKWSEPMQISQGEHSNVAPAVAIDAKGNPWVVWSGSDGVSSSIYYSYFDGKKWVKEQLLTDVDDREDVTPAIAFGPTGKALAAWGSVNRASSEIRVKEWNGKEWSASQNITAEDSRPDMVPSIAFNKEGKALVAWAGLNEEGLTQVYTAWRDAKGVWGQEQTPGFGDIVYGEDLPTVKLEGSDLSLYFEEGNGLYVSHWTGKKWTSKKKIDLNASFYHILSSLTGQTGGRAWFAWTDQKGIANSFRYNIVAHDLQIGQGKGNEYLSMRKAGKEFLDFIVWSLGEREAIAGGKKSKKKDKPFTKAASGDSITAGAPGVSWVGYWAPDVTNTARGGERATGALGAQIRRVPGDTQVLVIMAGTNDIGDGRSTGDIVGALNSAASSAKGRGVQTVYVCTNVPRQDAFAGGVDDLAKAIRQSIAVPFIETFNPLNTKPASFTVDRVGHLNESGAKTVGAIVKKSAKPR